MDGLIFSLSFLSIEVLKLPDPGRQSIELLKSLKFFTT
jgi:hypothetical protein